MELREKMCTKVSCCVVVQSGEKMRLIVYSSNIPSRDGSVD